ncbi:MAG TPA: hypothetical protein PK926_15820 [Spirochaetota bacterium]|nr:hypothetical protein [Spirochaetota bacterium]HPI90950.1 hypothetical protein [Spirochaetota bacterium]HPR47304.1 hypothetical protein [Spirochaetota bacterium]
MKVKKKSSLSGFLLSFLLAVFCLNNTVYAALTSVNLSLPSPTTMSNGSRYYLCSEGTYTYTFTITANNPTASAASDYDHFSLTIPTASAGNILITYTPATASTTVNIANINVTTTPSGPWSNPTVTFEVRLDWNVVNTLASAAASRAIVAEVEDAISGTVIQNTKNQTYGICANVHVVGFAQDGEAADGYVSPAHAAFNVTGTVTYDIPGYTLETTADAVTDADITALSVVRSTLNVAAGGGAAAFTAAVGAGTVTVTGSGLAWTALVSMGGTAHSSNNTLPLECNTVRVTALSFSGGTGLDPAAGPPLISDYYRSYNRSGANIVITAQTSTNGGSGQSMHGDTTFTVQFSDGTNTPTFTVTIPTGRTSVTAAIPYDDASGFTDSFMTDEQTVRWTYQVTAITGGAYELNQTGDGNGTAVTNSIKWDRLDPPSTGTPAINIESAVPTTTSIRLYWDPIDMSNAGDDRDFYEYRIYYNEVGNTRRQWDGDDDQYLRGLTYNETANTAYNFNASGWKYTTITGLKIFTDYEYYITAVDIFGNEITEANGAPIVANRTFKTQPYSIDVTISDGVTQYENDTFADLTPSVRTVRESAIRVTLDIVTSDEQPDTVRVWYTTDGTTNIVNVSTNTINSGAFAADTLFSADASRTGPNTYVAYLPTTVPIIVLNNSIRFVVETSLDEISTFSDSTIEVPPDVADPNNGEWTFYIGTSTDFKPWPTRVLNNVITKKSPAAYPAYYLSADAKVTIKVYDVKGRTVYTMLDNAYRKGGQNIKEKGWRGINKAEKRLGVGLYYIHFHAKRLSDGKQILNSFQKVVIAR